MEGRPLLCKQHVAGRDNDYARYRAPIGAGFVFLRIVLFPPAGVCAGVLDQTLCIYPPVSAPKNCPLPKDYGGNICERCFSHRGPFGGPFEGGLSFNIVMYLPGYFAVTPCVFQCRRVVCGTHLFSRSFVCAGNFCQNPFGPRPPLHYHPGKTGKAGWNCECPRPPRNRRGNGENLLPQRPPGAFAPGRFGWKDG